MANCEALRGAKLLVEKMHDERRVLSPYGMQRGPVGEKGAQFLKVHRLSGQNLFQSRLATRGSTCWGLAASGVSLSTVCPPVLSVEEFIVFQWKGFSQELQQFRKIFWRIFKRLFR